MQISAPSMAMHAWRRWSPPSVVPWRRISLRFLCPMNSQKQELRIFLIAGEPSGDVIGARLMASLKSFLPHNGLKFAGIGGKLMEKQGLKSEFLMDDISVMGAVELIPYIFKLKAHLNQTVSAALLFQPHVVIAIDSKGFCFRVLKQLKEKCSRLYRRSPFNILYVAPSVWAWKKGETRLNKWIGVVDHILCILPFEEPICRASGLSATFVGHPVLEDALFDPMKSDTWTSNWHIKEVDNDFFLKYNIRKGSILVSLLPGSRLQEVNRMMPIFREAMEILKDNEDVTVIIPTTFNRELIKKIEGFISTWTVPVILMQEASLKDKYAAFDASTVGLCTSGTAVLQMQLARLPCVVAYRANIVTEWLIKRNTRLKYMSLPNILLDSPVIPEALFAKCCPWNLANMLRDNIHDATLRGKQCEAADKVLAMLIPEMKFDVDGCVRTPSYVAAKTILSLVDFR